MLKKEMINGHTVTFKKKFRYLSKDFRASPYIAMYIDGKKVLDDFGFTKAEAMRYAKNFIKTKYGKRILTRKKTRRR